MWFSDDPRVANVKALGGVFNKAADARRTQIVGAAMEATKDMSLTSGTPPDGDRIAR